MRVFLVALLSIVLFVPAIFAANPDVEFESKVHDFGTVPEGTIIEHAFTIKNEGDANLVIQSVVPSCGCTVANLKKNTLKPGEKEDIKVSFDTAGFSGNKTKKIRVLTNDQDQSSIVLSLKGEITSDIVLKPSKIFIEQISKAQLVNERTFQIEASVSPGSTARIQELVNPSSSIKLISQEGTGTRKKIVFQFDENVQVGKLRERLILKLANSSRKSINIPIFANITRDLVLDPAVVSFGLIKGTEPLKRTVKINNYSDRSIDVTSVESKHPAVTTGIRTLKKGHTYLLDLELDPKLLSEQLQGDVVISTNDSENKSVTLNIFGVLPPQTS